MVRTFAIGRAGVSALAAAHGVTVRVLDIAVDDPETVRMAEVIDPFHDTIWSR